MQTKYPIGGYAPGSYYCTCATCGNKFHGDKRAVQCEPCAVADKVKFDALSPAEQEELMKRNAQIIKAMFSGKLPDPINERKEATGAVWVKATTRLPGKNIQVIVRNLTTGRVKRTKNFGHNGGWDIAMDHQFRWDNTEWLDESVVDNWISVEDRLPQIGEYVMVYNTEGAILKGRLMSNGWVAMFADGEKMMGELTATHWRPLPEAPKKVMPGNDGR